MCFIAVVGVVSLSNTVNLKFKFSSVAGLRKQELAIHDSRQKSLISIFNAVDGAYVV